MRSTESKQKLKLTPSFTIHFQHNEVSINKKKKTVINKKQLNQLFSINSALSFQFKTRATYFHGHVSGVPPARERSHSRMEGC